jgi:hypothetical protein
MFGIPIIPRHSNSPTSCVDCIHSIGENSPVFAWFSHGKTSLRETRSALSQAAPSAADVKGAVRGAVLK